MRSNSVGSFSIIGSYVLRNMVSLEISVVDETIKLCDVLHILCNIYIGILKNVSEIFCCSNIISIYKVYIVDSVNDDE